MATISKFVIALILASCFLLLPTSARAVESAAQTNWLGNSRCIGAENSNTKDVPTIAGFECMFENFLVTILALLGLAAFIMILYSGFLYLTAGEDAKKAEAAKSTLTLAIGGLAAAFVGWFILVIISYITGNPNLLQFNLIQNIQQN